MTVSTKLLHPLLQTIRGMCSDEEPYPDIAYKLADAVDRAKDLEAEVERLHDLREPKCPECEGSGQTRTLEFRVCPRCGGSGVERMVPLGEVVEWLEAEAGRLAVEGAEQTYQDDACAELARRIADRFGGGER